MSLSLVSCTVVSSVCYENRSTSAWLKVSLIKLQLIQQAEQAPLWFNTGQSTVGDARRIYRHGYWLTAIHWGNCSLKLWEKLVVKKEYLPNLKIWSSVFVPLMWTDVNWAENDATKWIPNGFTCGLCHREQMSEWIAASLNSSVFTESS